MPPKKTNVCKGKKLDTKKKKTPTKQQKETQEKSATMENKTKKTSTKQQKETKKKPATRGNKLDHCVVAFNNDQCELFESEDEARIQQH